ncbi:hypothetical protein [Arenimonas aestuarii]
MKNWKRPLIESLIIGSLIGLAVIFIARLQMEAVLEWILPVFYIPAHVSTLLSGDSYELSNWLYHIILILQFCLAAFVVGWLVGRYRTPPTAA